MTYYVVDTYDVALSWDMKKERGQVFGSRSAAEKAAKQLAELEPGKLFEVVQSVASVSCAVAPPTVKPVK